MYFPNTWPPPPYMMQNPHSMMRPDGSPDNPNKNAAMKSHQMSNPHSQNPYQMMPNMPNNQKQMSNMNNMNNINMYMQYHPGTQYPPPPYMNPYMNKRSDDNRDRK